MPYTLTIDFSKPIPVFPLADCVMLPHATAPLHIFESRYRAMTRDALDGSGLIAMGVFEGQDYLKDYQGTPPLRPCVCVGYIVHHERMADGRYNMLLQGVARAEIERELELSEGGYRRAILRPIERPAMEMDMEELREQIEVCLNDPLLRQLAPLGNVCHWLSPELPTPAVVDLTWQALSRDREQRYALLAESSSLVRAERLVRFLHRTRQTLARADAMGPSLSDNGLSLN